MALGLLRRLLGLGILKPPISANGQSGWSASSFVRSPGDLNVGLPRFDGQVSRGKEEEKEVAKAGDVGGGEAP